MIIRLIGAALVLIILVNLFQLLRHRRLREKYAVLWFAIGLVVIILAVFPGVLEWTARLLGVVVPSNLLFAAMLVLVIGVTLHLTWEQSRSEDRIRRLSEEIALLRTQVRELEFARREEVAGVESGLPPKAESRPEPESGGPGPVADHANDADAATERASDSVNAEGKADEASGADEQRN